MPAEVRNPAGHWLRTGTTLKPIVAGDDIETTGTITAAKLKLIFGTNSYEFMDRAGGMGLQSIVSGQPCVFEQFTNDGDTTDSLTHNIFARGTPTSLANLELLQIGYITGDGFFRIRSIKGGGGSPKDIAIWTEANTDQVRLHTDGSTSFLQKSKMTNIGGFAVRLTNKTGAASIAGEVVIAAVGFTDAVALAGANELQPIGVFLESGTADGSEAWVVVTGIADIRMDAGGCNTGDRIITSATAGRGLVNNAPAVAVHFQEIGHAIQQAGANTNARCVIHFL